MTAHSSCQGIASSAALVVVVGNDLGSVLDQGDNKFDIAHGVDNIEGNPVIDGIVSWR